KESTVGSMVADNLKVASVFDKYGIDYCCKGNRTLEQVCKIHGLDPDTIVEEINSAIDAPSKAGYDFNNWPIDLLADYIEKTHHRYVQKAIPEIVRKLEKITDVHGEGHPELSDVLMMFKDSAIALTNHMRKEELVLFPFIREMVNEGSPASDQMPLNSVTNPIRQMMIEHDTEGERFARMSAITNAYTVPSDGCNTYKLTMDMLKEFENDLHLHIHLENNILFPKALKLESAS
ncbi:MAG: iron-sulfur cluster repair di-iron protein, partial [Chloroflexota bacterium]